jgi:hypothetical protein
MFIIQYPIRIIGACYCIALSSILIMIMHRYHFHNDITFQNKIDAMIARKGHACFIFACGLQLATLASFLYLWNKRFDHKADG